MMSANEARREALQYQVNSTDRVLEEINANISNMALLGQFSTAHCAGNVSKDTLDAVIKELERCGYIVKLSPSASILEISWA